MTYLGEALLAIHEDGIPLAGTFSWGESFLTLENLIIESLTDPFISNGGQRRVE